MRLSVFYVELVQNEALLKIRIICLVCYSCESKGDKSFQATIRVPWALGLLSLSNTNGPPEGPLASRLTVSACLSLTTLTVSPKFRQSTSILWPAATFPPCSGSPCTSRMSTLGLRQPAFLLRDQNQWDLGFGLGRRRRSLVVVAVGGTSRNDKVALAAAANEPRLGACGHVVAELEVLGALALRVPDARPL